MPELEGKQKTKQARMENDRDIILIRRAREALNYLNNLGKACPLANEVINLGRTHEGRDKIFAMPEVEYDTRLNHFAYHMAYPNASEEIVLSSTSERYIINN